LDQPSSIPRLRDRAPKEEANGQLGSKVAMRAILPSFYIHGSPTPGEQHQLPKTVCGHST
jgi:hypothetical protein